MGAISQQPAARRDARLGVGPGLLHGRLEGADRNAAFGGFADQCQAVAQHQMGQRHLCAGSQDDGRTIGGQAQMFTSTKSAETALNRATWILCITFMSLTVILSAGWLTPVVGQ